MKPIFEYAPFRKYHTRRVQNLRGPGLIGKLNFLYEHDGEFRLNTDLLAGVTFALFAGVSLVTILIIVFG